MKIASLRQLNTLLETEERLIWYGGVCGPAPGSFPLMMAATLLVVVMIAWGGGVQIAAGFVAFWLIKLMADSQDDSNEYLVVTDKRLLCVSRKGKLKSQFDISAVDFQLDNDAYLTAIAKDGEFTTKWRCNAGSIAHLKHLEQSWNSIGRVIERRYLVKRDPI